MKWRTENWRIWAVVILALILRVVYVWQYQKTPYALAPYLDAKSYDDWAQEILAGNFMRSTAFYQSPLYSYFLALLYKIFGHSLTLVAYVQALLGAATVGIVAYIAQRHFGPRAGMEAGLLAALDRVFLFYTAPVLKETLMLFLMALFLYFALELFMHGRKRDAVWAGLLLGLTALVRGNVLILLPALILLMFCYQRWSCWKQSLILSAAVLLTLAPATWHNWKAGGDFVLINSCGGFNFYIGNSPSASGATSYPPFISTDAAYEEHDTKRVAMERSGGEELKPGAVSAFWASEARKWIAENPARWLQLLAAKFWFFWSDQEIGDNYDSEFVARESDTVVAWPLITFVWISVFAWFAFWVYRRRPEMQVLFVLTGAYMFTGLLFYVTDRYRLPVLIFLLPAAGCGTAAMTELVLTRQFRFFLRNAWPIAIAAALAMVPLPEHVQASDAFGWGLQATLYSGAGRDQEAIEAIKKAVNQGPHLVLTQDYVSASTSFERLGNMRAAEKMLEMAVEYHPDDGFAHYNLGRFYLERGWYDKALESLNKAVFIMPYIHQPYIALGALYYQTGNFALARESVRRGLLLDGESPQLLQLQEMLNQTFSK